jgi:hypothetical protein
MAASRGIISFFLAAFLALPQAADAGAQMCAMPSWNIKNINVTYSADNDVPGGIEFTFEDVFSKHSDDLSCQLPFSTNCEIREDGLNIQVQLLFKFLHITVNESYYCLDTPNVPEAAMYVLIFLNMFDKMRINKLKQRGLRHRDNRVLPKLSRIAVRYYDLQR